MPTEAEVQYAEAQRLRALALASAASGGDPGALAAAIASSARGWRWSTVGPANGEQLAAFLGLLVGAAVGLLFHPVLFLLGPLRWLAFVVARASHESGFVSDIRGDGGASVGLLQFHTSTVAAGVIAAEDRERPVKSGFAAGAFVWDAITLDWGWLPALMCPVLGWFYFVRLWTHGAGSLRTSSVGDVISSGLAEQRGIPSVLFWRGVTLIPFVLLWRSSKRFRRMFGRK